MTHIDPAGGDVGHDSVAALILPGMTLNATVFPDVGVPTVAPDFNRLRLGRDGSTATLAERRMGVYAEMLDALLRASDIWSVPHRIAVAHSFGGMLALWWLLNHRDGDSARVDALVLIATTAGPMYDRARFRLVRLWDREWRIGIRRLMPLWNRAFVTRAVKRLVCGGRLDTESVDFRAHPITSDLALDLAGWRNTDWQAMRSYRLALAGFDVRERLGEIAVPTIILHGTEDTLFDSETARDLARGLPNAELRFIPGAGHALPLTHGGDVVRAVRDVLGWRR